MFTPERLAELNKHFDVEELLTPGQVDQLIKAGQLFCTCALFTVEDAVRVIGREWLNENAPFEGVRIFGGTAISPIPLIIPGGWDIDRREDEAGTPEKTGIYVKGGFAVAEQVMRWRGFGEFMDGPLAASLAEDEYDQTILN
jgi:hypothetical protein